MNEVICHGIPNDRSLQDGDIVNVDVTIYLDGVHGDTNATFAVGEIDARSQLLMDVTRECLGARRSQAVKPGALTREIGAAIQTHAETRGLRRRAHVLRPRDRHGVPRRPEHPALRRAARGRPCSSRA